MAATPQDEQALVTMLEHAAELEHALCVQYLYAALTLKAGGDPQEPADPSSPPLTASQAAVTAQWDQQITRIAVQEMYHLMLANNLRIAVGAEPYLWRPNFPQPAGRYSEIKLPSTLAAFDVDTASRFMCWERPETSGWWVDYCQACGTEAHAALGLEVPGEQPYQSIGELYGHIRQALIDHPDWISPDRADRQVTSALVPFKPAVHPITTAADAARAIHTIVVEGEGTGDWQSMCHFAYFHQIVDELQQYGAQTTVPTSFAAWPTVPNPVYDPAHMQPGTTLVTRPAVRAVGLLFNDLYAFLVQLLTALYRVDDGGQRRTLADAALALMPLGIKPLGTLLTRLPAGDDSPGTFAGPSFWLPQPAPPATSAVLTPASAATALAEIARRCRVLSLDDTGLGEPAVAQLAAIAARLETLVPLLELPPVEVRS